VLLNDGSNWYSALLRLVDPVLEGAVGMSTIGGFIPLLLLLLRAEVELVVAAAAEVEEGGLSSKILFLQVGQLALTRNHSSTH
jgi:hypothetical protein